MPQIVAAPLRGIIDDCNQVALTGEGAQSTCVNLVQRQPGVWEPRTGSSPIFDGVNPYIVNTTSSALPVFVSDRMILAQVASTGTVYTWEDSVGWSTTGVSPTGTRFNSFDRAVYSSGKPYFFGQPTNVFSGILSGVRAAGAPKALGDPNEYTGGASDSPLFTAVPAGAVGWWAASTRIAYRVVWVLTDAFGRTYRGVPSPRLATTNNGVLHVATVKFKNPVGISTSWTYEIYRSEMVTSGEPSDEMQLVYTGNPTAGDIATGWCTVVDLTPDTAKGATIYTAPSQGGLLQSNEIPPTCVDIATFKGYQFYANTTQIPRYTVTMVQQPADGDTITINGTTLTAKTGAAGANQFHVDTAWGSQAQIIDATARNLCRAITVYVANCQAYYLGSTTAGCGLILIENINSIVASNAASWTPNIGTSVTVTGDTGPNRLFYSKFEEPEGVPLTNFIDVDSSVWPIRRILPLKESLLIFKDNGVWRLTGATSDNFTISKVDDSFFLTAPNSPAIIENQVFALTTKGVLTVTETATDNISYGFVETTIGQDPTAYGIGDPTTHEYLISTASGIFAFNVVAGTWSTRQLPSFMKLGVASQTASVHNSFINPGFYYGGSSPNGKPMIYGPSSPAYSARTLYVDNWNIGSSITFSGTTVTPVAVPIDFFAVGDVIVQGGLSANVLSVNYGGGTFVIDVNPGFTNNVTTYNFQPINCTTTLNPIYGPGSGTMKKFQEVLVFLKDFNTDTVSLAMSTEFNITPVSVTLTPNGNARQTLRTLMAQNASLSLSLSLTFSKSLQQPLLQSVPFRLEGFVVTYVPAEEVRFRNG